MENVAALVRRGLDVVQSDLAALGYDTTWTCLRASDVGAAHRRDRLFLPAATSSTSTVVTLPTPCARDGKGPGHQYGLPDLIERGATGCRPPALLPTPTASHYGSNQSLSAGAAVRPSLASLAARRLLPTPTVADSRSSANATAGRTKPLVGHAGHTLTDFVRLLPIHRETVPCAKRSRVGASPTPIRHGARAGSRPEALLPTPRASDGAKGCPAQRGSHGDLTLPSAAVRMLPTPTGSDGRGPGGHRGGGDNLRTTATGLAGTDPQLADSARWGPYTDAVARWERLLGRPAPEPTQPGTHGRPVLAPPFVEWLMGLDDGWVTDLGLPRTLALRVLGNGCVPHQAATALVLLLCPHRWQVTA